MKFVIKHEIKGRIRAHAVQYRMTFEQADRMQYYLESQDMITSAKYRTVRETLRSVTKATERK